MGYARRAGWLVLSVMVVSASFTRGDEPPSLFALTRKAVEEDRIIRTKQNGFGIAREPFSEVHARGGVLIGFDLGMRTWFDSEIITAVRPVYRTSTGTAVTRDYGSFTEATRRDGKRPSSDGISRVIKLRARAGYAVWAMHLRTGLGIDAMSLSFRKISGDRLDPDDAYRTAWVGNIKGGSESSVNGEGMPIVGVFGNRSGDRVNALGLIHVKPPAATVKPRPAEKVEPKVEKVEKVEKPAVVAEPKVEKVEKPQPPKTEPPRVVAEKRPPQPAPVQPAPAVAAPVPVAAETKGSWTHRHPLQFYSVALPPGWVKMLFVEQKQILQVVAGAEPADFAFRPKDAARLDESFIFVTAKPISTVGRSFDEIVAELAPAGASSRERRGAFTEDARRLNPGEILLDRVKHRFAWRLRGDGRTALHVCHVGRQHAVTIQYHSTEVAAAAEQSAVFAKVTDSFVFDPAAIYRPSGASSVAIWIPVGVFALVMAVAGGAALLFSRKGKTNSKPSRREERPRNEEEEPDHSAEAKVAPSTQRALAPSTGIVTELPPQTPLFELTEADLIEEPEPTGRQFTCFAERAYRVHVLADEIYLIDAGPADARKYARAGASGRGGSRLDHLDRLTSDELFAMADGEKHIRILRDDVWQVRIDAPGFWDVFGEGDTPGRLVVGHKTRGELKYEFRDADEMQRAIELLPAALGKRVKVNAVWDRGKKKFVQPA